MKNDKTEAKQHKHLRAVLPDSEIDEPWYWAIEIGYAWIAGFRPYLYWQNTTNCFNRMTNFTYHEIEWFKGNFSLTGNEALSTYEKVEYTLFAIQNFTEHLWFCNSAWQ